MLLILTSWSPSCIKIAAREGSYHPIQTQKVALAVVVQRDFIGVRPQTHGVHLIV